MDCDICGLSEANCARISAGDMSRAATKGFNPYVVGFPAGSPMEVMARLSSDPASDKDNWPQRAISGILSTSDWNVCSGCKAKLKPYLTPSPPSNPPPLQPPTRPSPPARQADQPGRAPAAPVSAPAASVVPRSDPQPAESLRQAIARAVKCLLILFCVLILKGVVLSFFSASSPHRLSFRDVIAFVFTLLIAGLFGTLFKPVWDITSHYLAAGVRSPNAPAWCGQHLVNLMAALNNALLLLFVWMLYFTLRPPVSRFAQLLFGSAWVTTVLNGLLILGSFVILFLIGRQLFPLLDLIAQQITNRIAPAPVPDGCAMAPPTANAIETAAACPHCHAPTDDTALFCVCCGTSLAAKPQPLPLVAASLSCPNCATQNSCASRYCSSCGTPLS